MIIPLNLPGERSKALSIVATTEGYSVAEVTIINGFGLHSLPSYSMMLDECQLEELGDLVEPVVSFDRILAKGPDLLQCLNDAMSALTK